VPNPFRAKSSAGPVAQTVANPFASPLVKPIELPAGPPPLPGSGFTSPFTVASDRGPVEGAAVPLSPFLAAITGAPVAAPAAPVSFPPLPQPSANVEVPQSVPEMRLSFPFHQLLGPVDAGALGSIRPRFLSIGRRICRFRL